MIIVEPVYVPRHRADADGWWQVRHVANTAVVTYFRSRPDADELADRMRARYGAAPFVVHVDELPTVNT